MDHRPPAALNPLPLVVWLLVLPVVLVEAVVSVGASGLLADPTAIGWRLDAMQMLGFDPRFFRQMVEYGVWPLDGVKRLVSYVLVHGSLTDAVFVAVFLLAMGKFVGEVFRWWAVLAVVLAGALAGSLATAALPFMQAGLIGGWPAVYGLIGAFTFVLWVNLGRQGATQSRAFVLIGMLVAIQLLFAMIYGGFERIVAELAGFAAGFLLSFVVSPGGWQAVRAKLRQR